MVTIPPIEQGELQSEIIRVKDTKTKKKATSVVKDMITSLINDGAQVIILACTELPLLVNENESKIPMINPNEILARVAVNKAKGICL